ncbi:MAG: integrase core domain-containing protein [Labedaea sp.]
MAKPSSADRLRHSNPDSRLLGTHTLGDRCPEPNPILTPRNCRPPRRRHLTPIQPNRPLPRPNTHTNTSAIKVLRRSVEPTNYTSYDFATTLTGRGMRQSVERTGVCWDNAMAESFFGALKNEWLNRMTFTTRAQARQEVVNYIEGFYNQQRLHSGLGYKTPLEVHNEYLNGQLAA